MNDFEWLARACACLALLVAGCGGSGTPSDDGGPTTHDAGTSSASDAGLRMDAGSDGHDAGSLGADAGRSDAGSRASGEDAGTSATDAGFARDAATIPTFDGGGCDVGERACGAGGACVTCPSGAGLDETRCYAERCVALACGAGYAVCQPAFPRTECCAATSSRHVVQVASGRTHVCVLYDSGEVECLGDNSYGELGVGTTVTGARTLEPHAVPGLGQPAVELAAGDGFTCARMFDGTAMCWGVNVEGQTGTGNPASSDVPPTAVMGLTNVTQIVAGREHACARLMDGTVRCWGRNHRSQLGDGTTDRATTPRAVPGVTSAIALGAGYKHTCALVTGGTAMCWGDNLSGALGDGTRTDHTMPNPVTGLAGAVELALGDGHTCARLASGQVSCWGDNGFGQLGNGTGPNVLEPTAVRTLADVREVAAGEHHTCVRFGDGTVSCFGQNEDAQLGIGSPAGMSTTPAQVFDIVSAQALGVGERFTCAVLGPLSVACWGNRRDSAAMHGIQASMTPAPLLGID